MGGRRESVPEVIFFSFAKLFLAWERGTSANEGTEIQYGTPSNDPLRELSTN